VSRDLGGDRPAEDGDQDEDEDDDSGADGGLVLAEAVPEEPRRRLPENGRLLGRERERGGGVELRRVAQSVRPPLQLGKPVRTAACARICASVTGLGFRT